MKLHRLQKKIKGHKGMFSQSRAQCFLVSQKKDLATNLQNKREFSTAQQAAAPQESVVFLDLFLYLSAG